jgi:ATP-binding cassette subfamily F protein uup
MMIEKPEFVILDEPTNHLDTEMLEYLEDFLKSKKMTVLMISHDRYFLDKVVNLVFELDKGSLHIYKGDYSNYVERKKERVFAENNDISKARSLLRKEKEWMQRGVKARETKSKERMERFYELEERAEKKIERILEFAEMETPRIGGKILEVKNLDLAYGDNVLVKDFNYNFPQGQRVGIVGANGAGKTSFLRLLMKEEFPDKGHVMHGKTISFGYFKQQQEEFDEDLKVIDVVREHGSEYLEMQKGTMSLSKLLEMFLFTPRMQHSLVKFLSGGQKRRLTLLTVLVKNPNFLILDEPTNDLDIMSLHALEDFLENYKGCVLFVSHDRYFVEKIADKLFVFEGGGVISQFEGTYAEYKSGVPPLVKEDVAIKKPSKVTNKELRENAKKRDKVMRRIEKLEARKAEILVEFSVPMGSVETARLSNEIDEVIKEIEVLELKWLELE